MRRELDFGRVAVSQIALDAVGRSAGPCPGSGRCGRVRTRTRSASGPAPMPASSVLMSLRSPPGCVSTNAVASTTKPSTTHQNESFERCCSISSGRMQRCASAALLDWFSDSSAWSELTTAGMAASRQRSSSSDESTALPRSVARSLYGLISPEQGLSLKWTPSVM